MGADLSAILDLLQKIMDLEKKIESAIASEADLKRRAKLLKACQERDIETIRELLFEV